MSENTDNEALDLIKKSAPFGYDPEKDLAPVDPFGFINLADAWLNHNVPTTVNDEIVNYNGIDDPESMLSTPKDIFEAYRMNDAIQKFGHDGSKQSVSPVGGES